jgi:TonB family protein
MPPTVKENEIAASGPETAQRPAPASASSADAGIKQQPVALEVPVTVNGARTIEGGDKREPFSETTKTVLVFGNGAVIRLSSAVAPGQLLFLTNEKTKKEVVCQVVKSKNYRNVSGYVELEFTESVVGFWGMRFPGDRIGSGPQPVAPAPAIANSSLASGSPAIPRPVAPRVEVPVVNFPAAAVPPKPAAPAAVVKGALTAPKVEEPLVQKPVAPVSPLSSSLATSFDPTAPLNLPAAPPPVVAVEPFAPVATESTIPEIPVTPAPVAPSGPESALFDAPRVSEAQASFLEPARSTTSVSNLLSLFEAKPISPAPVAPLPVSPAADPETEALKQQTARLQQQLSSMLFSGAPAEPATVSVQIPHVPPVIIQKDLAESAAKVLEISQISKPEPPAAKPVESVKLDPLPVKLDSPSAKSSLEDEELKIPSWLEPLARNAAAPTSTQELIDREKAKHQAEQPKIEQVDAETVAAPAMEELHVPELPMPRFGDSLPTDEERSTRQSGANGSGKGMFFGAIAAGVLVLVGGGWWFMQRSGSAHSSPAPAQGVQQASVIPVPERTQPAQPQGNAPSEANPSQQTNPAALSNSSIKTNSAPTSLSNVSEVSSVPAARNSQPNSNPANGSAGVATSSPAAIEQPKKPILGEVHFAAPKVKANRSSQSSSEPDAGVALTNDEQPGAEALNAGLVGGNNQPSAPVAPLPVGGDVKQAELISKVPPVYPAMAKTQHVSGSVLIDALIDANGKVTTMKVVSGPTLLHQAAMDALKQWKYQPAMLDGKPVSMHLTVTIQFRLQ